MTTELPALTVENALKGLDDLRDDPRQVAVTGDSRDGRVYVTSPDLVRAVKVALLTGRPLLLGGPPGGGKSSLAAYVARNLGIAYYEYICSDESRPSELLWTIDSVRRLSDAQVGRLAAEDDLVGYARYLLPGSLWWAMDPESAARRGLAANVPRSSELPAAPDPRIELPGGVNFQGSVLLIDEIDKADSAFSNGLLVPLGSRAFDVSAVGVRIAAQSTWSPLVIISSNKDRDLPPALLRRCVSIDIAPPNREQLVNIALRQLPHATISDQIRLAIEDLAAVVVGEAEGGAPSAAEFIDLVRVLIGTNDFDVRSEEWEMVRGLVTAQSRDLPMRRGVSS